MRAACSLAGGAMLLGALLRLANLGSRSLWLDEIMAAIASGLGMNFSVHYAQADVTPPLHYLLLVPFARTAWPEFWLRVPAAVSGILAIAAIYAWLARRGEGRAAAWAALLLALHPFALYHSQDARMYSHMMLLSILALWALEEAMRPGGSGIAARGPATRVWRPVPPFLGLAAALTLALYNSYFAAFQALSLGLYLVYLWITDKSARAPRTAWPALLALLAPIALLLPWLLWLPGNRALGVSLAGLQAGHTGRVVQAMIVEFGAREAGVVFWPLVVYGCYLSDKHTRMLGWLLLIVPVGFLLVYDPKGHFFAARYLAYLFPFAVAAAGRALAAVESGLFALSGRRAVATCVTAVLLCVPLLLPLYRYERGEKQNWRAAAAVLAAGMKPGDLVLTGVNDARIAVDYYLARAGASPFTDAILALARAQPPGVFPLRDGDHLNHRIALNDRVRETWQLEAAEELARNSPTTGQVWWVSAHPEKYPSGFHAYLARNWERVAVLPGLEKWGEIRIYRLRT